MLFNFTNSTGLRAPLEEPHMAKRTTHRSTAGKKLYAVRGADGQFEDIQTYERASAADQRKKSKKEKATAKKAGGKKAASKKAGTKKAATRKKAGKKAAKKK
jgi:hypothetical protein